MRQVAQINSKSETCWVPLLPIRAVKVSLVCLDAAYPSYWPQAALMAMLKGLLAGHPVSSNWWIDTAEIGRSGYRQGDIFTFLLGAAGDTEVLQALVQQLSALPFSAPTHDARAPFRNNWRLGAVVNAGTGSAERSDLYEPVYTLETLLAEREWFRRDRLIKLNFRTPAQILVEKRAGAKLKGGARFCHDAAQLPASLLLRRIETSLSALLREMGGHGPLAASEPVETASAHLFWTDSGYTDEDQVSKPMGGMLGAIAVKTPTALVNQTVDALLLGRHLGMGQHRSWGWGRFELAVGGYALPSINPDPGFTLADRAGALANVTAAHQHILSERKRLAAGYADEPADSNSAAAVAINQARCERVQARILAAAGGRRGTLRRMYLPKADGTQRELAVPQFWDRVAQRAVVQVLSPALNDVFYRGSFGYRAGMSRQGARDLLQRLRRSGFEWVFESDIEHFFDSVPWHGIDARLAAHLGKDPLLASIQSWLRAPVVEPSGAIVERSQGLPQGAPLSPLLANLMLIDFDADMAHAGFELVRYADDFVVACRSREQAQAAQARAERSLAEHGLNLNLGKTRITTFASGFRFLGYEFVNDLAVECKRALPASSALAAQPVPVPPKAAAIVPRPDTMTIIAAEPSAAADLDEVASNDDFLDADFQPASGEAAHAASGGLIQTAAVEPAEPLTADGAAELGQHLYLASPGLMLSVADGRLQIQSADGSQTSFPWRVLAAVIVFGRHAITGPTYWSALRHGVTFHFAAGGGRYLGCLSPSPSGPEPLLWGLQTQKFSDPVAALALAKSVVDARVRHQRELLRQQAKPELKALIDALGQMPKALASAASLAALNGHEGAAANLFFDGLKQCLPADFGFDARVRRPPTDPFNALLSLGYSVLYAHTDTVIRASGLWPRVGFYHQPRGSHAALASDLMEPFRHLVERTALALVHRRQIRPEQFQRDADGGLRLNTEALRLYLGALRARLLTPVTAAGQTEAHTLHEHLRRQCLDLIRWLQDRGAFAATRLR
jgi:group II intron reverse transcriptase/maturase/CRISPR-associated endonuclease Cas1